LFRAVGGRLECVGLQLGQGRGALDEPPIPASLLGRGLRWGSLISAARKGAADLASAMQLLRTYHLRAVDGQGQPLPDYDAFVERSAGLAGAALPRRGRPDLGDDHYREVARVYREAWARGDRAPTVAVAEAFSIRKTTAAKWVVVARRRGYLGPAVPRRAGI
jgi:hypothetical protein